MSPSIFSIAFSRHFITYATLIILTFIYAANGHFYWWGWPAITCLIAIVFSIRFRYLIVTPVLIAVTLYTLIMLTNIFFINSAFHIESLFFLGFLFFSYMLGRGLNEKKIDAFYKASIFLIIFLAIWAVFQYLTGLAFVDTYNELRQSNTVYTTPNSFAAVLNLFLIPVIIIRLCTPAKKYFDNIILLLLIALLVSQSRAGWIAFFGGLSLGTIFLLITRKKIFARSNLSLLAKALAVIFSFVIYHSLVMEYSLLTRNKISFETTTKNESITKNQSTTNIYKEINPPYKDKAHISTIEHRLYYYKLAWEQFKKKPIIGNGYFNFKYFLNRDNSYHMSTKGTTHFVHNDYLQHLLETGLIGFFSLMFIIAAFYLQLGMTYKKANNNEKIFFLATLASLTNFFIFALGDFVFYIPAITLFFGITLGQFDRISSSYSKITEIDLSKVSGYKYINIFKGIVTLTLITLFICPTIARHYASKTAEATDNKEYSLAFSSVKKAQRFAPYEADYIYMEAFLWMLAVEVQNSMEPANIADKLYQKAIKKNPMKKHILLARSKLHRDYPHLLDNPVNIDIILEWQEEVLEWENELKNNAAETEYINTLIKAGRKDEASKRFLKFKEELMQNNKVKVFLKQILNPK